jgi:hypothetical protein
MRQCGSCARAQPSRTLAVCECNEATRRRRRRRRGKAWLPEEKRAAPLPSSSLASADNTELALDDFGEPIWDDRLARMNASNDGNAVGRPPLPSRRQRQMK